MPTASETLAKLDKQPAEKRLLEEGSNGSIRSDDVHYPRPTRPPHNLARITLAFVVIHPPILSTSQLQAAKFAVPHG
jgi:hypothetical protein|tara:strand:+ start:224 stop:454 length:231 start_codon:yes stop_codon:yes gene_type:complete